MPVRSIMSSDIVKLQPSDPVSLGIRLMHQNHVRTLAVVGADDQFVGLFGIRQVVHLLLPKVAHMKFGLTNLSFMPDDLGELYHRLQDVGGQPVSKFLEKKQDLLICEPTTTLPELLELLHQSFNTSLPVLVVEGQSNRLVGLVSGWDVLEKLAMNVFNDEKDDGADSP
jgi:CBS domain-containing protein